MIVLIKYNKRMVLSEGGIMSVVEWVILSIGTIIYLLGVAWFITVYINEKTFSKIISLICALIWPLWLIVYPISKLLKKSE